jgi:phage terminase small subunit
MPVLKNEKRELFAQELAKGRKQVEAHRNAGYCGDKAAACRLEKLPEIQARIAELQGRAAVRAEVSVEKVLRELALLGFANMADYMRQGPDGDPYLDFSDLTREQAAALTEVTVEDFRDGRGEDGREVRRVKFKLADKRAALVDIGRHLGMFKDKVEHSGSMVINITSDDAAL